MYRYIRIIVATNASEPIDEDGDCQRFAEFKVAICLRTVVCVFFERVVLVEQLIAEKC